MNIKFNLNVVSPIILGIIIYLFFRDYKPELIKILFNLINLQIDIISQITGNKHLDAWLIYSFPDGLWAYSLTYFIAYTSINSSIKNKIYWLIITYLIIILQELLQGSLINGTLDAYDMLSINIAFFLALVIFNRVNGDKNETIC